jgi:hypothetical protein
VLSPVSTEQLVVVGDSMGGVGLFNGDLVLFDRAKLPSSGRCIVHGPGPAMGPWTMQRRSTPELRAAERSGYVRLGIGVLGGARPAKSLT